MVCTFMIAPSAFSAEFLHTQPPTRKVLTSMAPTTALQNGKGKSYSSVSLGQEGGLASLPLPAVGFWTCSPGGCPWGDLVL